MANKTNCLDADYYKYCEICKYNYEVKAENHIYTKRHKDNLTILTSKYLAKINEAKAVMMDPVIKIHKFEDDMKVWCYFCKREVPKHVSMESKTVCYLGMLSHLKSSYHLKKAKHFFWENRVDKVLLDQYLLKPEDYERTVANAIDKVKKISAKECLEHQMETSRIIASESLRQQALVAPFQTAENSEESRYESDEEPTSSTTIGPDISVYKQHLKRVKKSKLLHNEIGKNRPQSLNNGTGPPSKRGFPSIKEKHGKTQATCRRVVYKPYNSKKYTLD